MALKRLNCYYFLCNSTFGGRQHKVSVAFQGSHQRTTLLLYLYFALVCVLSPHSLKMAATLLSSMSIFQEEESKKVREFSLLSPC